MVICSTVQNLLSGKVGSNPSRSTTRAWISGLRVESVVTAWVDHVAADRPFAPASRAQTEALYSRATLKEIFNEVILETII
jgi:hypothetical protein